MEIDFKGLLKDNSKLLLSLVGLIVVAILMGTTSKKDNGVFDFWNATNTINPDLNGDNNGTNTDDDTDQGNTVATPLSNGKNNYYANAPAFSIDTKQDYSAKINTNLGSITIDLYETTAPNCVNNFVFLANNDFYDNTSFHRIVKNYIIQGGDPLGTGFGGPGYYVDAEIEGSYRFESYEVAMANSGSNSVGSQFFIISKSANTNALNGLYTALGKVTDGFDVITEIENVSVDKNYMPFDSVVIKDISISTK